MFKKNHQQQQEQEQEQGHAICLCLGLAAMFSMLWDRFWQAIYYIVKSKQEDWEEPKMPFDPSCSRCEVQEGPEMDGIDKVQMFGKRFKLIKEIFLAFLG